MAQNGRTKYRRQSMAYAILGGLGGAGLLAAFAFAAIDEEEPAAALIGVALALPCCGAAWWQFRKASPRGSRYLTVRPPASSVAFEEPFRVHVEVEENAPRDVPIEVGVVCTKYTKGRALTAADGYMYVPIDHRVAYEQWIEVDRRRSNAPITFTIPKNAPRSYETKGIGSYWEVVARGPGKGSARAPFEVRVS